MGHLLFAAISLDALYREVLNTTVTMGPTSPPAAQGADRRWLSAIEALELIRVAISNLHRQTVPYVHHSLGHQDPAVLSSAHLSFQTNRGNF